MIRVQTVVLTVLAVVTIAMPGWAAYAPHEYNTIESAQVAIHGYDPVSYYQEGGPQKGSAQYSTSYGGVKWRFSSEDNLKRFMREPTRYAPMYGGYCAYAAAAGYKSDIEPTVWIAKEGRLYLFYDEVARDYWRQRQDVLIAQADKAWSRLKDRPVI